MARMSRKQALHLQLYGRHRLTHHVAWPARKRRRRDEHTPGDEHVAWRCCPRRAYTWHCCVARQETCPLYLLAGGGRPLFLAGIAALQIWPRGLLTASASWRAGTFRSNSVRRCKQSLRWLLAGEQEIFLMLRSKSSAHHSCYQSSTERAMPVTYRASATAASCTATAGWRLRMESVIGPSPTVHFHALKWHDLVFAGIHIFMNIFLTQYR